MENLELASSAPLSLCKPSEPLNRSLLERSGAFAWWYLDALDEAGNGLVLIWSFGLPFLPKHPSERPAGRPSVNIAIYEDGNPSFYLLQTYAKDQARAQGSSWRFGRSRFHHRVKRGRRWLELDLDCEVPGTRNRLRGALTVTGADTSVSGDPAPGPHRWSPLMGPGRIEGKLRCGARTWRFNSSAYHDQNLSLAPLDGLDIDRWTWGRAVTGKNTLIYYAVWPKRAAPFVYCLRIDAAGRCARIEDASVEPESASMARYGMRYASRLRITAGGKVLLSARTRSIVDNGPFYLRTIERFEVEQSSVHGFAEWVRPDRVHHRALRPFVKMRVHESAGPNSVWLPLFTGPQEGRFTRLMGLSR